MRALRFFLAFTLFFFSALSADFVSDLDRKLRVLNGSLSAQQKIDAFAEVIGWATDLGRPAIMKDISRCRGANLKDKFLDIIFQKFCQHLVEPQLDLSGCNADDLVKKIHGLMTKFVENIPMATPSLSSSSSSSLVGSSSAPSVPALGSSGTSSITLDLEDEDESEIIRSILQGKSSGRRVIDEYLRLQKEALREYSGEEWPEGEHRPEERLASSSLSLTTSSGLLEESMPRMTAAVVAKPIPVVSAPVILDTTDEVVAWYHAMMDAVNSIFRRAAATAYASSTAPTTHSGIPGGIYCCGCAMRLGICDLSVLKGTFGSAVGLAQQCRSMADFFEELECKEVEINKATMEVAAEVQKMTERACDRALMLDTIIKMKSDRLSFLKRQVEELEADLERLTS